MRIVFILTLIGGIGLLGLAVWPVAVEKAVLGLPFVCLAFPLLGLWFMLLIGLAIKDVVRKVEANGRRQRYGLWSAGLMFATIGLVGFRVPQRCVFVLYASKFR